MDIAVLIPALNEAETIAETVVAALAVEGVTRAIVVDDGSDDDTAMLAERAGANVVRMRGSAGKGGALTAGAKRAENADIVVVLDADLGPTASQTALLLAPILSGVADMTIATFPPLADQTGSGLADRLARWGIARYGGAFDAAAPLSGLRAFTRDCFTTARPFSAGYGVDVGLTIRALRAGFRLAEVPTTMVRTEPGRDLAGFVHRGKRFAHVAIALVRLSREPVPVPESDDGWR